MNILIIESELVVAKELEKILLSMDVTISTIAMVDSLQTGMSFLNDNTLDLIFSEIKLADGTSFDNYKEIASKCPVIFISENMQHSAAVFDTTAISYLLKPLTSEKISKVLDKYRSIKASLTTSEQSISMLSLNGRVSTSYQNSLLIEQRDTLVPVLVNEIAYLYLKSTIIEINTISSHKYHKSGTLEQQQQVLNPEMFYLANGHFIIHRNAIVNVKRSSSRKLVVSLFVNTPEPVIVSKANASNFLHWLEDVL
ncbi:LytR/AlgR family response regulator transcription factor [Rhizosphaericola mali]|uniref:Response regulator transcription factor n=1 Tax=Rhizosphaericola mali TaxID=2545455 RepID=A0A5P2G035_9BACT|nr:LytTR family DNA-binding domain-containing protein [Rhizosphaericola mali]QES88587.1 response regulator transcription factor [Rhizosphaericola mali]